MTLNRYFHAFGFLCLLLASNPVLGFDRIVIFGDSLSDTGNATSGFSLPPPYFENRISNGFVAVDILADRYGLNAIAAGQFSNGGGDNYAVSGGNAAGNDLQDLSAQITAFQARNPQGFTNNTLTLLMIGGNDLRDGKNSSSAASRTQIVNNAVDAITSAISTLGQLGARYILVSNAPDISRIPETLTLSATNPAVAVRAREVTTLFNSMLASRISQLSASVAGQLVLFDLYSEFNQILNQPTNFGFTVADQACFDPGRFRFNPGCNFNRFVFFDSIHPTAKTHALLGDALYRASRPTNAGKSITGPLLLLLE